MFKYSYNFREIKDIYELFQNNKLIIDQSYQRRSIWATRDKVRLIETILLNLVVPEVFFWKQNRDHETGNSITHIVDGQQRISAIVEFIDGRFSLDENMLFDKDSTINFKNKSFNDLTPDEKNQFWDYSLTVVEIDRQASIEDIKKMFVRMNLTSYNLNEQERRNALEGTFASLAIEISQEPFWGKVNVFNSSDIKRMKDVEYSATIILLCRKGIIDQTTQKIINQAYDDLKDNYDNAGSDKQKILFAMELILCLKNKNTESFLRKKTQLYTLFSLAFYMLRQNITVTATLKERFINFVQAYNLFKNNMLLTGLSTNEDIIYNALKKYKLASSEGINKHVNRTIRFNVLKEIIMNMPDEIFNSIHELNIKMNNFIKDNKIGNSIIEDEEIED